MISPIAIMAVKQNNIGNEAGQIALKACMSINWDTVLKSTWPALSTVSKKLGSYVATAAKSIPGMFSTSCLSCSTCLPCLQGIGDIGGGDTNRDGNNDGKTGDRESFIGYPDPFSGKTTGGDTEKDKTVRISGRRTKRSSYAASSRFRHTQKTRSSAIPVPSAFNPEEQFN